jgi:hypothetical protein
MCKPDFLGPVTGVIRLVRTPVCGLALVCLVALVALCAVVPANAAPPVPPTLTDENLYSVDSTTGTASCNPDGSGTMRYRSTGTAFGPYPGTFSETGTITIGPAPPGGPAPGVESLPTRVFAAFHIASGDTTITGVKSFAATGPMLPGALCSGSIVGLSYARTNVRYIATIDTGRSCYADYGGGDLTVSFPPEGGPTSSFMSEDLISALSSPRPVKRCR